MCGLVGVFGEIDSHIANAFQDLLEIDVIRGSDSTGAVAMKSKGKHTYWKTTNLPTTLLKTKSFRSHMSKEALLDTVGLLGHNRAATRGKVNKENAHPFLHGNIIMMHNGTLKSQIDLDFAPKGKTFDTDSERLCYTLSRNSVAETWSKVDGAAALVWVDTRDSSLNFLRNSERSFEVCLTGDKKTLMWASEGWMLEGVALRRFIQIDKGYAIPTETNTHYKWKYKNGRLICTVNKLTPFVKKSYGTSAVSPKAGGKSGEVSRLPWKSEGNAKTSGTTQKTSTSGNLNGSVLNTKENKDSSKDPTTAKKLEEFTTKTMSLAQWDATFSTKSCDVCLSTLTGEWKEAVIIKQGKEAICGECAEFIVENNLHNQLFK